MSLHHSKLRRTEKKNFECVVHSALVVCRKLRSHQHTSVPLARSLAHSLTRAHVCVIE